MGDETASGRITLLDQRWFTKTATLRGRTPTEIYGRFSLFWDVTLRTLVVTYRRFGKTYQPHLQRSSSPELRNSNFDYFFLSDIITQRPAVLTVSRQSTDTKMRYQGVRTSKLQFLVQPFLTVNSSCVGQC